MQSSPKGRHIDAIQDRRLAKQLRQAQDCDNNALTPLTTLQGSTIYRESSERINSLISSGMAPSEAARRERTRQREALLAADYQSLTSEQRFERLDLIELIENSRTNKGFQL